MVPSGFVMVAPSVTVSPVNTVPLGVRVTVAVGVEATDVTLTVSVPVSAGLGPPFVAVTWKVNV